MCTNAPKCTIPCKKMQKYPRRGTAPSYAPPQGEYLPRPFPLRGLRALNRNSQNLKRRYANAGSTWSVLTVQHWPSAGFLALIVSALGSSTVSAEQGSALWMEVMLLLQHLIFPVCPHHCSVALMPVITILKPSLQVKHPNYREDVVSHQTQL